jgi:hypothetical protein
MLNYDHQEACKVSTNDITPFQQPSTRAIRTSVDCFLQQMLKFPDVAVFYSYAEYLYAGLCEGSLEVTTFFPKPFRLMYQGKPYVPDAYIAHNDQRIVIELTPKGEFDEAKKTAMVTFFGQYNMQFEVLSYKDQLLREVEALNWWILVRELLRGQYMDTTYEEQRIMNVWPSNTVLPLNEFIDPGDRETSHLTELALFRLTYRGSLQADFKRHTLDYSTEFRPCHAGVKH